MTARRLINNLVYSRPEDERPALLAAGDRLLLHDDQTVADLLTTIKTAMIAAQPKHSKVDHQKYRRDQKTHLAMLRTTLEIDYAVHDAGIDPGKRHAPQLVQSAMIKRAEDPNRDYDIKVPSLAPSVERWRSLPSTGNRSRRKNRPRRFRPRSRDTLSLSIQLHIDNLWTTGAICYP